MVRITLPTELQALKTKEKLFATLSAPRKTEQKKSHGLLLWCCQTRQAFKLVLSAFLETPDQYLLGIHIEVHIVI